MTRPGPVAVVGTDTGVGKTVVAAGITRWLRSEGVDAAAVKPCQTGYPPDDDAGFVRSACADAGAGGDAGVDGDGEAARGDGQAPDADGTVDGDRSAADAAVCLRTLEPPLAPAVAADREGVDLSYDRLLADCRAAVAQREAAVVEGIGGLRVPLADGREVLDLVADLDLPAVVVARSGLGTLNHTALSVAALRDRSVEVRGVVLNRYAGESVAERTNPDVIAERNDVRVARLPPAETGRAAARSVPDRLPRWLVDP